MRLAAAILFAMNLAAFAQPARANGIASSIVPQPDSPIHLLACSAGIQFFNNVYGTYYSNVNTQADFENTSGKSAVAVLVHFQLASAFGNTIGNIFGSATGTFAANAIIKGNRWTQTDTYPGLGEIKCSVARVLFSDGSEWLESKATPNASSSA